MEVLRPDSLAEALEMKSAHPGARPLMGGTDLMVELNFGRARPDAILDLTRCPELCVISDDAQTLRLGAGVTYTALVAERAPQVPGLAIAARTIGSPQIRNRGTIGGNLGTSSPAGDALPPLVACDAEVELANVERVRRITVEEFVTGVKTNALDPDELITAVHVPVARGPQQFSKIGTRNAMVIAVATFALSIDPERRTIGTGIGSAAPRPVRARAAEEFLSAELDWDRAAPPPPAAAARFGELVADAASPIDDVRGTARYRRHALAVMARRTFTWVWDDFRRAA